jgi:hypothetical protein
MSLRFHFVFCLHALLASHSHSVSNEHGTRSEQIIALNPPPGFMPISLSILQPSPGAVFDDEIDLSVSVAVDVGLFCGTNADDEREKAWSCAPVDELVLCVETLSLETGLISRQLCLPLNIAVGSGQLSIIPAHLPIGAMLLTSRLLWARDPRVHKPFFVTSSPPINIRRSIQWSLSQADALADLLPLEKTPSTIGLRIGRLRHGIFVFNINDVPAGTSLHSQGTRRGFFYR